jgi:ADP-heptose:LPS heptosyltransferase
VEYYLRAAMRLVGGKAGGFRDDSRSCLERAGLMELGLTEFDREEGERLLRAAGVRTGEAYAVLNPGGNNPAKRWPVERFVALGRHLSERHAMRVLVNGSPQEADLTREVSAGCGGADLPALGGSVSGLKGLLAGAGLLVTNDTGPRHIAAAFSVPVVTLFGPTDHRWTTIPTVRLNDGQGSEELVLADPELPEGELANDHPERCRIERIGVERVIEACERLMSRASVRANGRSWEGMRAGPETGLESGMMSEP